MGGDDASASSPRLGHAAPPRHSVHEFPDVVGGDARGVRGVDPTDRPEDGAALLRAALGGEGGGGGRPRRPPRPFQRQPRRSASPVATPTSRRRRPSRAYSRYSSAVFPRPVHASTNE